MFALGSGFALVSGLTFIVTEKHVISPDLYKEDAYLSSTRMRHFEQQMKHSTVSPRIHLCTNASSKAP